MENRRLRPSLMDERDQLQSSEQAPTTRMGNSSEGEYMEPLRTDCAEHVTAAPSSVTKMPAWVCVQPLHPTSARQMEESSRRRLEEVSPPLSSDFLLDLKRTQVPSDHVLRVKLKLASMT